MKCFKLLIIISLVCLAIAGDITLSPRYGLARVVRSAKFQNEWLSIDKAQRKLIIERIATRFPRLEAADLGLLDNLIENGNFKGNISPLTIEEIMEKIEQFDNLNEQIFGTDFKPLKIKFIFDQNIEVEDLSANMDLDKGILTFKIPTRLRFNSDWFLHEIFYSYVHEDGHIKACLINYSEGRREVPFDNSYWFGAIAQGDLNSSFLELSDYQKDFRNYLRRENGLFTSLDETGYIGQTLLFRQIQETLNDKLLYLIHGDYYGQALLNLFQNSYQDILQNPQALEYRLLHSEEGISIKDGIFLLMRNINRQISSKIFGDQQLYNNFQQLGVTIIEKINAPDSIKQIFQQEYNSIVSDFIILAESLSLNHNLEIRIGNYQDELQELWRLLTPTNVIP